MSGALGPGVAEDKGYARRLETYIFEMLPIIQNQELRKVTSQLPRYWREREATYQLILHKHIMSIIFLIARASKSK